MPNEGIQYAVPQDILFGWISATKDVVKFPGMEAKIGKIIYHDMTVSLIQMEHVAGMVKDQSNLIPWRQP